MENNETVESGEPDLTDVFKTEEGISELYSEGLHKYPGWTGGLIHIITRAVENSEGDGRPMFDPPDIAINHIIGGMASLGVIVTADHSDAPMDLEIQTNTQKLGQLGGFCRRDCGTPQSVDRTQRGLLPAAEEMTEQPPWPIERNVFLSFEFSGGKLFYWPHAQWFILPPAVAASVTAPLALRPVGA